MSDPTSVRIRERPWLTMVELYALLVIFSFVSTVIEARGHQYNYNKTISKDDPTRKERQANTALESRAQEETARLQNLMKEAALIMSPTETRARAGAMGPVIGNGVMTREELAASIMRARGSQRPAPAAAGGRPYQAQPQQPYGMSFDPADPQGPDRQGGTGGGDGYGGGGGAGGADDPATPADFEANFGRGVEEGDSQFFMYAHSPRQSEYEFGFRKGTEDHFQERYEKGGPAGSFKTKVRWGDRNGGYGEHYWDFNHAGQGAGGGGGGGTGTGTGTGAAAAYGFGRAAASDGAPAEGGGGAGGQQPAGAGGGMPDFSAFIPQGGGHLNSQAGGNILHTVPGPNLGHDGETEEGGLTNEIDQQIESLGARPTPVTTGNPSPTRNRNNRRGRNGRRNRNRNRGRNNRQRGNNASNQRPIYSEAMGAGAAAGEESPGGAGEASLTENNDADRTGNNFRRFFKWPFQGGLPTIGRSDSKAHQLGVRPVSQPLNQNWPFSRRSNSNRVAGNANTPTANFKDPRNLAITNRHKTPKSPKTKASAKEEEEESDDEGEEEESEGGSDEPPATLQYNPVDARVKVTSTPEVVRIPSSIRGRTRFGTPTTRRPARDPVATLLDPNAITNNPESLETLSINELESLLQKLTRIPKAKPDGDTSAIDSALSKLASTGKTTKALKPSLSSAYLPMEPRESVRTNSNTTFPAEKVLSKFPLSKGSTKESTSEDTTKASKLRDGKSKSEELFGSNNPFLAFDVESGKVYEQKTGRVFRLSPVP